MDEKHINKLLEEYLSNSISKDEFLNLRRSINDVNDKDLGDLLHSAWIKEGNPEAIYKERADKLLPKIKVKLRMKHQPKIIHHSFLNRYVYHNIFRYVAFLLILFLTSLTLYLYQDHKAINEMMSQEVIFSSPKGQRASVTLPDGTSINMNSNSSIRYQQSFGQKERSIHFQGEGYFEVAKNADMPFVVYSKDLKVEVLGTTFNFYCYDKADYAELALVEGHVKVQTRDFTPQIVRLSPNEKVTFREKTNSLIKEAKTFLAETAWIKKTLKFEAMPLREVFYVLSRKYGVTIKAENSLFLDDLYSGTYTDQTLSEILDVLKIHYRMKITKDKDGDNLFISFTD